MKKSQDRGAGPYSKNDVVFRKDKSVNAAGNPVRRPQASQPNDGKGAPVVKTIETVSSMGMSRPLQKSPIKRYFGR